MVCGLTAEKAGQCLSYRRGSHRFLAGAELQLTGGQAHFAFARSAFAQTAPARAL